MDTDTATLTAQRLIALMAKAQAELKESEAQAYQLLQHLRQCQGLDQTGHLGRGWQIDDIKSSPFQIRFRNSDKWQILCRGIDVTEWLRDADEMVSEYFTDTEETEQSQRDDFAFEVAGDR